MKATPRPSLKRKHAFGISVNKTIAGEGSFATNIDIPRDAPTPSGRCNG